MAGKASDWYARKLNASRAAPPPAAPVATQRPAIRPLPDHVRPEPNQQAQSGPPEQLTGENFFAATAHWKGGEAHRVDGGACPRCGGQHFFSRKSTGAVPRCFDCGYTEGTRFDLTSE